MSGPIGRATAGCGAGHSVEPATGGSDAGDPGGGGSKGIGADGFARPLMRTACGRSANDRGGGWGGFGEAWKTLPNGRPRPSWALSGTGPDNV